MLPINSMTWRIIGLHRFGWMVDSEIKSGRYYLKHGIMEKILGKTRLRFLDDKEIRNMRLSTCCMHIVCLKFQRYTVKLLYSQNQQYNFTFIIKTNACTERMVKDSVSSGT